MKIALINTVAGTGSTGRITQSLYREIVNNGDEAMLIYGRGTCAADINSYKVGTAADFFWHVLRHFFTGMGGFFSTRRTRLLIEHLEREKPDLIHLHNIHGFYLDCEELFAYIKRAGIPVIWTLHDCWSFTGHCAYFDYVGCEKWKTGCHDCPQYRNAYPYSLFRDNTGNAYTRKKHSFQNVDSLVIVTPCEWLKRKVQASYLSEYPVKVIYNGIDTDKFYPEESNTNTDRYTLLGVANIWEKRKGLIYFEELLKSLGEEYTGVLVGVNHRQCRKLRKEFPENRLKLIQHTKDVDELRKLYNKATVFVNPTLEDNFPTTNLEAMACGLPVVAFDTGGCAEAIQGTNGVIVPKKDVIKLTEAVQTICWKETTERKKKENLKIFDNHKMLEEYMKLYQKLVNSRR